MTAIKLARGKYNNLMIITQQILNIFYQLKSQMYYTIYYQKGIIKTREHSVSGEIAFIYRQMKLYDWM